jgi:hypothetical protein
MLLQILICSKARNYHFSKIYATHECAFTSGCYVRIEIGHGFGRKREKEKKRKREKEKKRKREKEKKVPFLYICEYAYFTNGVTEHPPPLFLWGKIPPITPHAVPIKCGNAHNAQNTIAHNRQ